LTTKQPAACAHLFMFEALGDTHISKLYR
jgi:hypothetical protein